ncbi:MAG TPA: hypothetical protein VNB87_13145 [Propionibacteriaceae bacterium]|jgi:hypothetical protein|nr:hypothetical protein [Propionibacteriaceae bacterium]
MSNNQKLTNRTAESGTRSQAGDKKAKGNKFDLSATQVVGGALAAMTAAALGSQLSVAGTVIGAALASIIAAVAGSLYTASIRRTHDKVKTVFWTGQPNEVEDPTVMEILPDSTGHVAGQRSHLVAPEPNGDPSPPPRRPKLSWKRVAVAALAAFGIAAVALTTFELVTGHALSGGQGTTIQQVSEGKPAKESDTKKKAPSKEPTNKATTTKSETPTTEPSEAASSEPTETETTTEPTPEAQATTAPETTPSSSR